MWGVRDHADRSSYGENILGGREAIPFILDLLAMHDVAATWATVGFVFCENRDELFASIPPRELRPTYTNQRLSSYSYLSEVGTDERNDPYSYGSSLVQRIQKTPRQEIGTHTLSHYYCLEPGQTQVQFEADMRAALALAERRGIQISSIVFPRNQYAPAHLDICRKLGLTEFRGTQAQWAYQSAPSAKQGTLRRGARLLDAHTGLLGDTTFQEAGEPSNNVPASQFLRPLAGRLSFLHPMHRRAIMRRMTFAARRGRGFHLWWHPHNFGSNVEANIQGLSQILTHFSRLRNEYGMRSCSMAEAAS